MTSPERDEARDAAVYSLIVTVVSLALQVGIMLVLANRDTITRRLVARYRWLVYRQNRQHVEDQLIAELRRDISRWEHDSAG